MVPSLAPTISAISDEPLSPLTTSVKVPSTSTRGVASDRSLLAPEDAFYQGSPPRKQAVAANKIQKDLRMTNGDSPNLSRRGRRKDGHRSSSRRRKGAWKKLLWVKQSCERLFQLR
jgi:phosphatidylinositol N-acetylglucosaminyltransferase subunit C